MTDLIHAIIDDVHAELDARLSRRADGATESTSIAYTKDGVQGEKIRTIPRIEWHEETFRVEQCDIPDPAHVQTWVAAFDVVLVAHTLADTRNLTMNLIQALYYGLGPNNYAVGNGEMTSQQSPENARRGHVIVVAVELRVPVPVEPLPVGSIDPAPFETTQTVDDHEISVDLNWAAAPRAFSEDFSTDFG
jgi:hypothetical protein